MIRILVFLNDSDQGMFTSCFRKEKNQHMYGKLKLNDLVGTGRGILQIYRINTLQFFYSSPAKKIVVL